MLSQLPTGTTLVDYKYCVKGDYILGFTISTVAWFKVRGFVYRWQKAENIGKVHNQEVSLIIENRLESKHLKLFHKENVMELNNAMRMVQAMIEMEEGRWVEVATVEGYTDAVVNNPNEEYMDSAYEISKAAKDTFGNTRILTSNLILSAKGRFHFELIIEVSCGGRTYQIHSVQSEKKFKLRIFDLQDPALHWFIDPSELVLTE